MAIARTPNQLAKILRSKRKSQHLSQKVAGSKVGLLPKTISALENNPDGSSIESLFRLLSALDMELVVRSKSQPSDPSKSSLDW